MRQTWINGRELNVIINYAGSGLLRLARTACKEHLDTASACFYNSAQLFEAAIAVDFEYIPRRWMGAVRAGPAQVSPAARRAIIDAGRTPVRHTTSSS